MNQTPTSKTDCKGMGRTEKKQVRVKISAFFYRAMDGLKSIRACGNKRNGHV